jgi:hypothetical protein
MPGVLVAWLLPVAVDASPTLDTSRTPRKVFTRELAGDSTHRDIAANVLPLAEGALVTGWTSHLGGPAQGLVIRVDGDGNVLWRRELGGGGADLLFAAQPDRDGFLCLGFTSSQGAGSTDGWFVRIDSDGAPTWDRVVGGEGEERLTSLVPTPTGWMAAGQRTRAGDTDAWVVSLDRAGKEISQWTWGGPGVQRGLGVVRLADGGCVISGRMGESDDRETVDGFVTRLGPDGKAKWTQTIGGTGFQVAYHLRSTRDGSLLVTGYGFAEEARHTRAFVLRLGADGRIVRRQDHLGLGAHDGRATQSVELEDGSTVTVGYEKTRKGADDEPIWLTWIDGLDPRGSHAWPPRIVGKPGHESGRWIAVRKNDLWVVSQASPAGVGSHIVISKLDARVASRRRTP